MSLERWVESVSGWTPLVYEIAQKWVGGCVRLRKLRAVMQNSGFLTVDDEHGQEIVEPVRDPGQGTSSGSEANRDASVSVILTDPEVLDCSICLEPLSVPVFQVCQYF